VEEAVQRLDDWTERLRNGITVGLERRRARIAEMAARLPSPRQVIAYARVRLAGEARALGTAVRGLVRGKGARLAQAEAVLESCSYERVLERGFTLVWDDAERAVRSVQRLAPRMALTVRFHDGAAGVTVNEDTGKGAGGTGAGDGRRRASKTQPGKPRPKPSPDDRQGTLL
jgi:exodeoxyribonuclease VII large subunit